MTVDLPEISKGISFDPKPYAGNKAKIAPVSDWEVCDIKSKYGTNGKELPKGETIMVKKLRVVTEPVATVKDSEGKQKVIRASELFGLTQDENGVWGVPTHEKSGMSRFLKTLGLKHYKELVGQTVPLKLNGDYLGFYVK